MADQGEMRVVTGDGSFSIGSPVWPGVSKLIEEMGEALQVLGKLMATHGDQNHWDGSDLVTRLEEELGDVGAALAFVVQHNPVDEYRITDRMDEKFNLFEKWHGGNG